MGFGDRLREANARSAARNGQRFSGLLQPKTKRGKRIGFLYSVITGAVTLALVVTHTWPASYFSAWRLDTHSFVGDFPQYAFTLLIVHVALLPLRYWLLRRFDRPDQPETKVWKDSELLDD